METEERAGSVSCTCSFTGCVGGGGNEVFRVGAALGNVVFVAVFREGGNLSAHQPVDAKLVLARAGILGHHQGLVPVSNIKSEAMPTRVSVARTCEQSE